MATNDPSQVLPATNDPFSGEDEPFGGSESFLKVGCLLGYDICLAVFWNDLAFILVSSFKEQNLTNAN